MNRSVQWRAEGAGRAQDLEGAPAQLVGTNCKKKSRHRQISKVTSLQSAVADAGFTKWGGTPSPEGAIRVGLCGRGGANYGGGRRCKHWPPGAGGDPRYATVVHTYYNCMWITKTCLVG